MAFGKVIFFSGSVGFSDLDLKRISDWNWFNYVSKMRTVVSNPNDWKCVLWGADKNVFAEVFTDENKKKEDFLFFDKPPENKTTKPNATIDGFARGCSIGKPKVAKELYQTNVKPPLTYNPTWSCKCQDERTLFKQNCSSPVLRDQLSGFVKRLVTKIDTFPVFSVSDCNTFHNTGYVWGLYAASMAYERSEDKGIMVVLNYDFHQDLGEASGDWIKSDGWGAPLLAEKTVKTNRGMYVVIGEGGNPDAKLKACVSARGKISLPRNDIFKPKEKDDWKKKFEQTGYPDFIFVTVDRDVFQIHNTQWLTNGKGFFKEEEGNPQGMMLRDHLEKVLTAIRKAVNEKEVRAKRGGPNKKDTSEKPYLAGFDITGMPEHHNVTESGIIPLPNKIKAAWNCATLDINKLLEWATVELNKTAQKYPKVVKKPADQVAPAPPEKRPQARPKPGRGNVRQKPQVPAKNKRPAKKRSSKARGKSPAKGKRPASKPFRSSDRK